MLSFRRKKPRSILGIDIGSTSVKILELSNRHHQYCVEGYCHMLLPQHVTDPDVIARRIKALLSSDNFSSKQAVIAVPDASVMRKVIQINACIQERDIEEWVFMAAEQYIPYPLDEISLDFNLLGPSATHSDKLDVLVVASRSKNVAQRLESVRRAGLVVEIVDVESYAIERAVRWFANPSTRMTFATTRVRDMIESDAPLLMVACGLALRGFQVTA